MTRAIINLVARASLLTAIFWTNNQAYLAGNSRLDLLASSEADNQNRNESVDDTQSESNHFSVTDSSNNTRSEAALNSTSVAGGQHRNESGDFMQSADNPAPPGLPSGVPDAMRESSTSDYVTSSPHPTDDVEGTKSTSSDSNNSPASTERAQDSFQVSEYVKNYLQSNHARANRLSGQSK